MKPTPNRQLYDSYDADWQKLFFDEESQGFVVAHREHGFDELPINLAIAKRLATHFGERIELLPRYYGFKLKSIDSTRNGKNWEFKISNGSATSIQKRICIGSMQCSHILLALPAHFEEPKVIKGITSAVNMDKTNRIKQVDLLLDNNQIVHLTRQKIVVRDFSSLFEALSL